MRKNLEPVMSEVSLGFKCFCAASAVSSFHSVLEVNTSSGVCVRGFLFVSYFYIGAFCLRCLLDVREFRIVINTLR